MAPEKETRVRSLYETLALILTMLEAEDENIDTTKITGGGILGVEWVRSTGQWVLWEG